MEEPMSRSIACDFIVFHPSDFSQASEVAFGRRLLDYCTSDPQGAM
jgi:hypothetical protein